MTDQHSNNDQEDEAFEAFFAAARAKQPMPSEDLLARVIADAGAHMPSVQNSPKRPRWHKIQEFLNQVGGIPGASVMTACAVFGVLLGYSGPESVSGIASFSDVSEITDLDTDIDIFEMADFSFDESDLLQ